MRSGVNIEVRFNQNNLVPTLKINRRGKIR
jgi:hypothetical protein